MREIAGRAGPFVAAGERQLMVAGPLGGLLPAGGVRRGATVAMDGALGTGVTSLALTLAAAATTTGEWAAMIDPHGTLGARAAEAAGVELERFAVVRRCPADRWSTVVAALLDGVALVVTTVPVRVRLGDARRLVARARERASVLVAVGSWPAEAALRIHAEGNTWCAAVPGAGRILDDHELHVRVEAKGAPVHGRLRAG